MGAVLFYANTGGPRPAASDNGILLLDTIYIRHLKVKPGCILYWCKDESGEDTTRMFCLCTDGGTAKLPSLVALVMFA